MSEDLQKLRMGLEEVRSSMEYMKKNQSLRGIDKYRERMAHRSLTHKSWRQLKGMQAIMFEIQYNRPWAIGYAVTCSIFGFIYFSGCNSPEIHAASDYYQRYYAHKDEKKSVGGGH